MEVLDKIPFELEFEKVLEQLRVCEQDEDLVSTIKEIFKITQQTAMPKAVYDVCYPESKNEDSLIIAGVKFTSRILRINFDKAERVFPYIATCGRELDNIRIPTDDPLVSYYFDLLKEMVLSSALNYLKEHLMKYYIPGKLSTMNPGSLKDWPIEAQTGLFSIFGNVEDLIGVKLTESLLMVPVKSVSGIYFPSEINFESCRLCPREKCPGRKMPFDTDFAKTYRNKIQ